MRTVDKTEEQTAATNRQMLKNESIEMSDLSKKNKRSTTKTNKIRKKKNARK